MLYLKNSLKKTAANLRCCEKIETKNNGDRKKGNNTSLKIQKIFFNKIIINFPNLKEDMAIQVKDI